MASSISKVWPGVYTKITDNSQYIEALSSNMIGFICVCSEKGPDNVPRMTTSASDFIRTYGSPNNAKYGQASYIALQYLKTLSNLYVMRVTHPDATYAFKAWKLGHEDSNEVTTYQVDSEGNKVELTEAKEDNAVLVSADDLASKSLEQIISDNTTQNEAGEDVSPFIIIPESAVLNYTIDPTVKLYGVRGANRSSGETEVTSMRPTGDVDMAGFKFTGKSFSAAFESADVIQVSNSVFEDLTAAQGNSDNITVVEFDSSSVELPIEDEVKVVETVNTERNYVFEEAELSGFKTAPEMEYPLNNDLADIIFYPYGRGEYYNNIGFKLTKAKKSYPEAFVLDIYTKSENSAYPSLVESFIISFDRDATDSSGASIFIQDVLDRYSEYLRCKVSENIGVYEENSEEEDADGNISNTIVNYDGLAMTQIDYLAQGSDGPMYTKSGAINWQEMEGPVANAYLGLNINPDTGEDNSFIQDTEDFDITLVLDFGGKLGVKTNIVELCNIRNTCFGLLDNGYYDETGNKNAQAAINMRLTDHNWSNYRVALYEPYTKVYDAYTGKYIWVSPLFHVIDNAARTARDYDIFWAFA